MNVSQIVGNQHRFFATGKTRDLSFRIEQLKKLKNAIEKFEPQIIEALQADMHKPVFEAYTGEIALCIDEIKHAVKHLHQWAKPKKVPTPILHFWSTSKIYSEPVGVTLNIAPWNYPFQLCIAPLAAAMSAGNCMVLKPSELAPRTSSAITKMIAATFDPAYVTCVEGGVDATQALLAERFDHIFFTGGTAVGKVIMQAAAKNLTPVTLELGGKSPCIIDENFPIEHAARRIAWGKFFNAGQTCVGPDYLLVPKHMKAPFIDQMKKVIHEFYGNDPGKSTDYARIINTKHYDRLTKLLQHGRVVIGGETRPEDRYIAPTVIDGITLNDPIMAEEIFGPILPILEYDKLDDAIATVQQRPKPLALYLFSTNKEHEQRVLQEIQFGGGCINDCLIHLSSAHLPFGGIGPSGIGAYHGRAGFDLFSHRKSVLKKTARFDVKIRYAPYSQKKVSLVKRLFAWC